jgi:hypothetical protein
MALSKEKKKVRSSNELELLKLILDENKELKKKVLKFIQKSLGKTTSITAKNKKGGKSI